jgi:hypothetical protein
MHDNEYVYEDDFDLHESEAFMLIHAEEISIFVLDEEPYFDDEPYLSSFDEEFDLF